MKRVKFNLRSKKAVLATVAAVVALGLGGFGLKQASATEIRDCSGNSIIKCGELSPSAFINQVKKNDDNNGHHDLQAIYANFGLVPSDYQKFVDHAEMGTDYRNGNIVVDGQTVATNSWSIGRYANYQGSGYFKKVIDGKTYYGNYNDKAFGANVQSIPVMVMFNSKGVMQFAVMTACGNPAPGKTVTPNYSCDLLQSKHDSGNTYSFSTKATATNNAKLVKVVYDFGDGSNKVTETSLSKEVQHTYTKPGSYTATVTVYVSLPGKQTVTVTSAKCKTKITVAPPPQVSLVCSDLTLTPGVVDQSTGNQKYTLTATGAAKNATITGYAFTFGDNSAPVKVATDKDTATTTHTYAPGTYTANVVVSATANGKNYSSTSANCQKSITINKPSALTCDQLTLTPGDVDTTTGNQSYTLAATASAKNASISKYVFTFGDGNSQTVTSTDTTASTTHTYAPGTYKANVAVVGVENGKAVTVTSGNCAGSITVKSPVPEIACDGLTLTSVGAPDSQGNQQYNLVATASATNATITGYTFNFGDNSQTQTVTTADTTASTTHTYAPGSYNPSVSVTVTLPDGTTKQVTSAACAVKITVTPPTCTAPNGQTYPAGSAQCTPTCTSPTNGQTYPAGSPQCQTPPTLPNTGSGDVIGLFIGSSIVSALGYYYITMRRLARR